MFSYVSVHKVSDLKRIVPANLYSTSFSSDFIFQCDLFALKLEFPQHYFCQDLFALALEGPPPPNVQRYPPNFYCAIVLRSDIFALRLDGSHHLVIAIFLDVTLIQALR